MSTRGRRMTSAGSTNGREWLLADSTVGRGRGRGRSTRDTAANHRRMPMSVDASPDGDVGDEGTKMKKMSRTRDDADAENRRHRGRDSRGRQCIENGDRGGVGGNSTQKQFSEPSRCVDAETADVERRKRDSTGPPPPGPPPPGTLVRRHEDRGETGKT